MGMRQAILGNMGMRRDNDIALQDGRHAWENLNIRITARDRETLLAVTNERGNVRLLPTEVKWTKDDPRSWSEPTVFARDGEGNLTDELNGTLAIEGTLIGYGVLNDHVVLFTHRDVGTETDPDTTPDRIYRLDYTPGSEDGVEWRGFLMLEGDYGFSADAPIETLCDYESEDVQKVYWLDGVNQPRLLNISDRYIEESGLGDFTKIDFVSEFEPTLEVSIEKVYEGAGLFTAGIVQYLFTYSNKYGQQSNIAYISPVYYASPSGRGGAVDENCNCQFRIRMSGFDTDWQYVNVYRVAQSAEGGAWTADRVAYLSIGFEAGDVTSCIDNGSSIESVDPTSLLYVGGREITAYTMCAKDSTLFLGNLSMRTLESDGKISDIFKDYRVPDYDAKGNRNADAGISSLLSFRRTEKADGHCIPYPEAVGFYPYECQLDLSSDVMRTFKAGEKYRIGMRLITATGMRSAVYWVGDVEQTFYPEMVTDVGEDEAPYVRKAFLVCAMPDDLLAELRDKGYTQVELMMAEMMQADRAVAAQGFVCPTVYSLKHRTDGQAFAYSSWYARPRLSTRMANRHDEGIPDNSQFGAEIQCVHENAEPYASTDDIDDKFVWKSYSIEAKKSWLGWHKGRVRLWYGYEIADPEGGPDKVIWQEQYCSSQTRWYDTRHNLKNKLCKWIKGDIGNWRFRFHNPNGNTIRVELHNSPSSFSYLASYGGIGSDGTSDDLMSHAEPIGIVGSDEARRYADRHRNSFYADENVFTFHSPDIDETNESMFENAQYSIRVIGVAEIASNITDYEIEFTNPKSGVSQVVRHDLNSECMSKDPDGLLTFPLFYDTDINCVKTVQVNNTDDEGYHYEPELKDEKMQGELISTMMYIYPWHKTGSITMDYEDSGSSEAGAEEGEAQDVLGRKVEANLRYSYRTDYLWTDDEGKYVSESYGKAWSTADIFPLRVFDSEEETLLQIDTMFGKKVYEGNYDFVLTCREEAGTVGDDDDDSSQEEVNDGYHIFNTNILSAYTDAETIYEYADDRGQEDEDGIITYGRYKNVLFDELNKDNLFYDPVEVSVKSTPHIVVSLREGETDGEVYDVRTLPTLVGTDGEVLDGLISPNETAEEGEGGTDEKFYLPWAHTASYDPEDYPDAGEYWLLPSSNTSTLGFTDEEHTAGGEWYAYDTLDYLKYTVYESWLRSMPEPDDDPDGGETYGAYQCMLVRFSGETRYRLMLIDTFEIRNTFTPAPWGLYIVDKVFDSYPVYTTDPTTGQQVLDHYVPYLDVTFGLTIPDDGGVGAKWTGSGDVQSDLSHWADNEWRITIRFTSNGTKTISMKCTSGDTEWCHDSEELVYGTLSVNVSGKTCDEDWETRGEENRRYACLHLTGTEAAGQAFLNSVTGTFRTSYFWDPSKDEPLIEIEHKGFRYDTGSLTVPAGQTRPLLLVAELYSDFSDGDNRYGGTSDYAVQSNTFIPLGNVTRIDTMKTGAEGNVVVAYAGDTYFQRWDCQKTYPWSDDKENGISEFVSLMLETRKNIEGRSDLYRGFIKNTAVTPENSNTFNGAYGNLGTLLSYNVLDGRFSLADYPTQVTWTVAKQVAADVDAWTNVTLASVLAMPGEHGAVRALRMFSNDIVCMQDRAVSQVQFNERAQVSTESGVPVELANSGRVDGSRILTSENGCTNKWSVMSTKTGLWFVDDLRGALVRLSQKGSEEMASGRGFSVWLRGRASRDPWRPDSSDGMRAFYDWTHDDLYLSRGDADGDPGTLCFSETLDEFSSFYTYGRLTMLGNVSDRLVAARTEEDGSTALWLQGEGAHDLLFGGRVGYSVTYRAAPEPSLDKTFTGLEWHADVFDDADGGALTGLTFDRLDVWDEWQTGGADLSFDPLRDAYPDVRRKFRRWRADVPREDRGDGNPFGLNRMRNPWLCLRLSKDTSAYPDGADLRMVMHDLLITYFA